MDEKKPEQALTPVEVLPARPLSKTEQLMMLSAEEQLEVIEKHLTIQARLREIAIKATDETDWDDFHGRPRLNAKGAKNVRQVCFLKVETDDPQVVEQERDDDGRLTYFAYRCHGTITSPWGTPMDCVGRTDCTKTVHTHGGKLQPWEVDRSNVADHAQTLCITRGVTQYMGLERLTWEDLSELTDGKVTRARVQIAGKEGSGAANKKAPAKGKGRGRAQKPKPPKNSSDQEKRQALWVSLKAKADAKGWGEPQLWEFMCKQIPTIKMPMSGDDKTAALNELTVGRLQFLNKQIEEADKPTKREPGSDDDKDGTPNAR